ncbi:cysteine peptidase family C39 domain-containing protein, partial [Rhizobium rhizogenes]
MLLTALHNRSRIEPLLQSEAAECGLACLAMVAGYHGHRVTLSELRRRHAVS